MTCRVTRSRSKRPGRESNSDGLVLPPSSAAKYFSYSSAEIAILPDTLDTLLTGFDWKQLELLRLKQRKLRDPNGQIPTFINKHRNAPSAQAVAATLVFAQEEAGTAVCISPSGLLLTCSHCIAGDEERPDETKQHWLLFANGAVVEVRCLAWDGKLDLALLQVTASQSITGASSSESSVPVEGFPSVNFAPSPPRQNAALHCIGHPGSEDLEVDRPGVKTAYDVLHVSNGRFRGLAEGQDVHDNSEIGALKHDCWTYWGHSGAPLLDGDGMLVGLHSSWDDTTSMRRGVAWEALKAFLEECDVQ